FQLGGKVGKVRKKEYGRTDILVTNPDLLFKDLNPRLLCWMSHGDSVKKLAPGFIPLAKSVNTPYAACANPEKKIYGVQFHPEVVHTPWGKDLFHNWLYYVCGVQGNWTMGNFVKTTVAEIKKQVGRKKVICGLSGGVDSAATAALVHKAIGKNLTCIFVDHGFLRKDERQQVEKAFVDHFRMNLIVVNAKHRFLKRLTGVTEPEEKRKIIGEEFIRTFEEESRKIGKFHFLAQGTLYPDIIESAAPGKRKGPTHVIKSHHNVGGLPEDMDFDLIEPLRNLFKDEVRAVCLEMGLPHNLVYRQPFPGPGLAIRIIGEITDERLKILQESDAILRDEILKAGLSRSIWQYFTVLPVIRSVGVMGDERTYEYPIIIRAVTSEDGMTSDWARIPFDLLEKISNRIVNEVDGINRVAYDITSKPPATIEWE
ncbi:glutamine-hydrolyzing GMP synthase, partial [bacterium]|nr:glutamine-hydrolyzing GMP synthase [bacterium]MBU1025846.1 glutamine-hydrolyzing GMP synthase [bacterium]